MAKTRLQGRAYVRNILSTSSSDTGQYDNDELDLYLNDEQKRIAALVPTGLLDENLLVTSEKEVAASAANPSMSKAGSGSISEVLRLVDVFRASSSGGQMYPVQRLPSRGDLVRHRRRNVWPTVNEQSDFYAEEGPTLYFTPGYTSSQYYTVEYVKVPPELSATQGFTVPDYLYPWVCRGAAVKAFLKEGDNEAAMAYLQTLSSEMAEFNRKWSMQPLELYVPVPEKKTAGAL